MTHYRIEMQETDGRWFIIGGAVPRHDVEYWLGRYRALYSKSAIRAVPDIATADDHAPRNGEAWGDWHKRTHTAEALQRKGK